MSSSFINMHARTFYTKAPFIITYYTTLPLELKDNFCKRPILLQMTCTGDLPNGLDNKSVS